MAQGHQNVGAKVHLRPLVDWLDDGGDGVQRTTPLKTDWQNAENINCGGPRKEHLPEGPEVFEVLKYSNPKHSQMNPTLKQQNHPPQLIRTNGTRWHRHHPGRAPELVGPSGHGGSGEGGAAHAQGEDLGDPQCSAWGDRREP